MTDFKDYLMQDARLTILKELSKQNSASLNETILTKVLETFGHYRSREWVRTQILKLEELGAVRATQAGSVIIATLTQAGLDHVERRSVIDGVAKPSLGA